MSSVAAFLYLFVLLLAPAAFGCKSGWELFLLESSIFLALLLYSLDQYRSRRQVYTTPALLPLLLFTALILIQVIPLPMAVIKLLSPVTHILYRDALGDQASTGLYTFSILPNLTLQEFFRFASYAAFYLLTVQFLQDRTRLKRIIMFAVIVGTLIAAVGIYQKFYGPPGKLLGIRITNNGFGPFNYENHFAGFMEALIPLSLTLFLYSRSAGRRSHQRHTTPRNTSGSGRFSGRPYLLLLPALIMITALALTESRGGKLCAAGACILLFLPKKLLLSRSGILFFCFLLLFAMSGAGQLGWESIDAQYGKIVEEANSYIQDNSLKSRLHIWQDATGIIRNFPVLGTGFGTFHTIYPSYNSHFANMRIPYAHNDYVEIIAVGGFVTLILITLFLLQFLRHTLPVIRKRHSRYAVFLYIGGMAGVVAILAHSTSEFLFFGNGAVGLYFFLLLGLMVAAANTGYFGKGRKPTLLPLNPKKSAPVVAAATSLALLTGCFFFVGGNLLLAQNDPPKANPQQMLEQKQKTLRLAPLDSHNYFSFAFLAEMAGQKELGRKNFSRALRLNPAEPMFLELYGHLLTRNGEIEEAEKKFKAAIRRDRLNSRYYQTYIRWLLSRKRKTETYRIIRKLLAINPAASQVELSQLLKAGYTLEELQPLLPDRVEPLLAYATLQNEAQNYTEASRAFLAALNLIPREATLKPSFFLQPYRFFMAQGDKETASKALNMALSLMDDDYTIHLALGDYYRRENLLDKARSAYRYALRLAPDAAAPQKRLDSLPADILSQPSALLR